MTTNSEIIKVYARTLLDLAAAADADAKVGADLATISEAVAANPALADALSDASLPAEKKAAVIAELFAGVSPEALGVALSFIERVGAKNLGSLVTAFDEVVKNERGVVVAEVTTASPLGDDVRAKLIEKLSANIGKPVIVRERVDGSLLGGIRINVAGRVLDGSIKAQLGSVRSALTNSSVGGEA